MNKKKDLATTILDAALKHVQFDGWSDQTIKRVCKDLHFSESLIYQIFPRGGIDLALTFHKQDDARFVKEFSISKFNESSLGVSDRVENAIISRLAISYENKEAVKRSISLFSTPFYLSEGTRALWDTCDKIWMVIGDKSDDFNWYSKRITLTTVYSAALFFWIDDESNNSALTKNFVQRRIANVMEFERVKRNFKNTSLWTTIEEKFKFKIN